MILHHQKEKIKTHTNENDFVLFGQGRDMQIQSEVSVMQYATSQPMSVVNIHPIAARVREYVLPKGTNISFLDDCEFQSIEFFFSSVVYNP